MGGKYVMGKKQTFEFGFFELFFFRKYNKCSHFCVVIAYDLSHNVVYLFCVSFVSLLY